MLDPRVEELLVAVKAVVDEDPSIEYAIGGALAMQPYGVRRATSDVDVFALDSSRVKLFRGLRAKGFTIASINDPFHYIAYNPEEKDREVRIDLLFPAGEPELSAIEYPQIEEIGGIRLNVFPVTLLVLAKFYSDRSKDQNDIGMLYHAGAFDPDEVVKILEAIDAPEYVEDFKHQIENLRKHALRMPRRRPKKK